MNTIREIERLNKRELENAVPPEASWHADYRDTAYVYVGGLSFDLTEGDIITIFSQFGEPVYINLVRDKETGKSKGFAFLKYEDQRSTDLAVDNLGGATVLDRVLKVDHTRYKPKEEEDLGNNTRGIEEENASASDSSERKHTRSHRHRHRRRSSDKHAERRQPLLKEEKELEALLRDHDEDDPMKGYLLDEKKEGVARARARAMRVDHDDGDRERAHHHHHRHRSHNDHDDDERPRRHRRRS
ncbi:hypothetical protein MMC25_001612 [Agyrium rufum]|nr:hypothetical protein [Agyrium rufum]